MYTGASGTKIGSCLRHRARSFARSVVFFYPKLNCAISISRSLFPLDRKKKKEKGGEKIDTGGDEQKGKCEGKKRAGILLVEEDIRSFIVRFDGNDQSNSFHSGWIHCKYNRYRIIGKFFPRAKPGQMRDYCFITGFADFFRPLFSAMRFDENWGHSWAYRVTIGPGNIIEKTLVTAEAVTFSFLNRSCYPPGVIFLRMHTRLNIDC